MLFGWAIFQTNVFVFYLLPSTVEHKMATQTTSLVYLLRLLFDEIVWQTKASQSNFIDIDWLDEAFPLRDRKQSRCYACYASSIFSLSLCAVSGKVTLAELLVSSVTGAMGTEVAIVLFVASEAVVDLVAEVTSLNRKSF
jgi:hypothetical protein